MRCKYNVHWLLAVVIIQVQQASSVDQDFEKSSKKARQAEVGGTFDAMFFQAVLYARGDDLVQERCHKLGWEDMGLVNGDPFTAAIYNEDISEYPGTRLIVRFDMVGRKKANEYNEYVDVPLNFTVFVDLKKKEVVAIEDKPNQ